MASFLLALGLFAILKGQTFRECADFEECKDSSRIKRDTIICSGEQSCYNSLSLIAGNKRNPGAIICSGSASCAFSTKMRSSSTIHCTGSSSCSSYRNDNDVAYSAKNIYCEGTDYLAFYSLRLFLCAHF